MSTDSQPQMITLVRKIEKNLGLFFLGCLTLNHTVIAVQNVFYRASVCSKMVFFQYYGLILEQILLTPIKNLDKILSKKI